MVGIWRNFIISKNSGGSLPPKNLGPKTCKILVNFGPLQTLIANVSLSGELWSTNGLELHVNLDPLKCTFLGDYISAHRGCCALIFLHALEMDQALLAHTPTWAGVPPKFFNRENLKFGLKFSVYTSISSELMGIPVQIFIQTTCREPGTCVQFLEGLPPKIWKGKKTVHNFSNFLTTFNFDREYPRSGST